MSPSSPRRARSPVRYIRWGQGLRGSWTKARAVCSGSFQYPRATPLPSTHSSPVSPTAASRPSSVRMWTRMFSQALPMGRGSWSAKGRSTL